MIGEQLLLEPCPECGLDNPHDGAYVACRRCAALLGREPVAPVDEGDRYAAYEAVADRIEAFAVASGDRFP